MSDGNAENHWRRTLWAMVSVQFIISSAFSIIPPVIPLLLPALGVRTPGAVRAWAGVLIGVTPLAAALMSPWWGRLADQIDRRAIILIACGTAAACTASMSLVTHPWQLLALRFAMGLFGGHVAAGMALVSTAAPAARLGWALGWVAAAQLAGTLLGPVIGGSIADAFASYRAPFVSAGAAALLVGAAIAMVPAQASLAPGLQGAPPARHASALLSKYRELSTLVIVLLLAQCAIMSPQPIISLHVRELVGQRSDLATLAGFAFSIVALSGLLASPLLGTLGDAIGARRVLLMGVIVAAPCTLMQAFAPTYGWFVAERFLGGLFLAGIIPTVNTLIGKSVAPTDRGQTYGLAAGATFFGAFLGPVVGGLMGAQLGLSSVFFLSGGVLLINAIWIAIRLAPVPTPLRDI